LVKRSKIILAAIGIFLMVVALIITNILTLNLYTDLKNKPETITYRDVKVNTPVNVFLTEMQINTLIGWFKDYDSVEYEKILNFYDVYTKNRQITIAILERCLTKEIPINQGFGLAWWESDFDPTCKTYNPGGSVDRGLFQLNNGNRKNWKISDFYDIDKNCEEGLSYLSYCISLDEDFDEFGFICYNGGTSVPKTKKIKFSTVVHLIEVKRKEKKLDIAFNTQLLSTLSHVSFNTNNSVGLDIKLKGLDNMLFSAR
jgi:hypothetical protein